MSEQPDSWVLVLKNIKKSVGYICGVRMGPEGGLGGFHYWAGSVPDGEYVIMTGARAAALEAEVAVRDRALEIIHGWQGEGKPMCDASYVGQALQQAHEEIAAEPAERREDEQASE